MRTMYKPEPADRQRVPTLTLLAWLKRSGSGGKRERRSKVGRRLELLRRTANLKHVMMQRMQGRLGACNSAPSIGAEIGIYRRQRTPNPG
jgi:hypothetical protein